VYSRHIFFWLYRLNYAHEEQDIQKRRHGECRPMKQVQHSFASKFLLVALILLASAPSHSTQVQGMRLGQHADKTRLVLDLSAPVEYTVATQSDPLRLVIEISEIEPGQLPLPPLVGASVTNIQVLVKPQERLQVTLFLSHAATVKSFLLPPHLDRGDRLVVDIYDAPPVAAFSEEAPQPVGHGAVPVESQATARVVRPTSATTSPRNTVSRSRTSEPSEAATQFEVSGTWEQEWAYQTDDTGNQKFEALLEPRLDVYLPSGSRLVGIARIRLDAVGDLGPFSSRPDNYSGANGPIYNDEYAELSLRELYLDTQWAEIYWRLGKQQVVWGQADGIKVLDVVNPQSFREFILDDFDDSRTPLWMVNAEVPLGEGGLQLLWIPDTTYHELAEAGSPYFLTSPKWVPSIPAGTGVQVASFDKPDNPLEDSDLGVRYTAFWGGWDISLNYLYHYQDYPVLYQQLETQNRADVLRITPTYKRNNLIGGTLSNAFNELTLRAELAYSTDTYHTTSSPSNRGIGNSSEFASVMALDWQYNGNGLLSAQWFLSHLPDYSRDIVRDENEHTVSLLFQQAFANETWQLRVLGLYSLDDEDTLLQLKLKYWLLGNLELWVGGDFFNGTQRGTFGQFNEASRALLGFEYGF
jgi:Protein of unknown function (DUF1302)/AMIN domain